jgi:hypothetical protein
VAHILCGLDYSLEVDKVRTYAALEGWLRSSPSNGRVYDFAADS